MDSTSTPPNTLVVINNHHLEHVSLAFGARCVYLGDIAGMAGHVIFATEDGRTLWGYHDDNFSIIPEDLL